MKKGTLFLILMFCICTGNGTGLIRQDGYNIADFGAVNDGKTINTKFIQMAIDKCSADGGGQVIIPNGNFRTGSIFLKHNVVLYLSPTTILSGSTEKADYTKDGNALIVANEQNNIGVYGRGTINGNGNDPAFYGKDPANGIPGRPNVFSINKCVNVKLKEFTLINGTRWNIHLISSDFVSVEHFL